MRDVHKRRAAILLWSIVGALLFLVVVKFFVADVYRVDSGSMRPTLFGGPGASGDEGLYERVLVAYDRSPHLARFDPVVLRSPDGGKPIVKRVVGLPGETISITEGDLLIEGRRLPPDAPRPAPIVLFDDEVLDVSGFFQFEEELWTRTDQSWVLDATGVGAGEDRGMMKFHKELLDGYIDHRARRVPGLEQVNDGILECEVRMDHPGPGAMLRFELLEEGDTFKAQLVSVPPEGFLLRLLRVNGETLQRTGPGPYYDVLFEEEIPFRTGIWRHVEFANVDNTLSFELDDVRVMTVSYAANVPYPRRTGTANKSIGPRVGFGAEGCQAAFRSILVLRDLYYTERGEYAVSSLLSLGPGEFFLAGDNSADSRDSRDFGPVQASEILGRPIAVVWPPDRMRRIKGAE